MQKLRKFKITKGKFKESVNMEFQFGMNGSTLDGSIDFMIDENEVPSILVDDAFTHVNFKNGSFSVKDTFIIFNVGKKRCDVTLVSKLQALKLLEDLLAEEYFIEVVKLAYVDYYNRLMKVVSLFESASSLDNDFYENTKDLFVLPKLKSVSPTPSEIEKYSSELQEIKVFTDMIDEHCLGGDYNKLKKMSLYIIKSLARNNFENEIKENNAQLMEYIKDEIFDYNAQNYLDEKKIFDSYSNRFFDSSLKQHIYENVFSKLEDIKYYLKDNN